MGLSGRWPGMKRARVPPAGAGNSLQPGGAERPKRPPTNGAAMRPWPLLALVLVAGCLDLGQDHVFPDESAKVVRVQINAYAKVGQDGVVEIRGVDAQNVTRAFEGTVVMRLDEQHDPPSPPAYTRVTERTLSLTSESFSNPGNAPVHTESIARHTFPEAGTYRLSLDVDIGGRHVPAEPVLFYAEP